MSIDYFRHLPGNIFPEDTLILTGRFKIFDMPGNVIFLPRINEQIPACLNRFNPLCLGTQGDAGLPEYIRLLLDAAGVGYDTTRIRLQLDHINIAQWVG